PLLTITNPWSRAWAQIARSGAGANATSVTWAEPGYRSASAATRRAASFSSKSSLGSCSGSWAAHDPALALGGERQARADVLAGKLREVGQDLVLAHAGRKVGQDIADRDARAAHARLAEPNLGV